MYVMIVPAIYQQVSNAIYCLNTKHFDKVIASGTFVSRGDEICWITYKHLPKMGFWGGLQDAILPAPSYSISFKSPVSGRFEQGFGSSFHHLRNRDYSKQFVVRRQNDEIDERAAYRFYTNERVSLTAYEFYKDLFAVFFDHEEWAEAGMRDSSNYVSNWKEVLITERRFMQNTLCPVIPEGEYRWRNGA